MVGISVIGLALLAVFAVAAVGVVTAVVLMQAKKD